MSKERNSDYREVYSTERGAICAVCGKPSKSCSCSADKRARVIGDGNVKVRRETKGRGGKTVTSIAGLALNENELKALLSDLKRRHGGGGEPGQGDQGIRIHLGGRWRIRGRFEGDSQGEMTRPA